MRATRRTSSFWRSRAAERAPPRSPTGCSKRSRDTEVIGRNGQRERLLDSVDVITGVSGGSFTALAYGLYGDRLFSEYEQRFLKRDVQGELIGRALNPVYWGPLSSPYWGRSELAADLYDEILFNGATFADLQRGSGPMIVASATDLNSGARFYFTQKMFDILCSDLSAVRLSRAAASSSGVPVVLSPVTIDNYAGTCGYKEPPFLARIEKSADVARPAARAIQDLKELRYYEDGKKRPYLHLVDGGVADNLAMREILAILEELEALHLEGMPTPLDHAQQARRVRRQLAVHSPARLGSKAERPGHGGRSVAGDRGADRPLFVRSGRASARHRGALEDVAAHPRFGRDHRKMARPGSGRGERVPNLEVYVINVSFAELKDAAERAYLNEQPTSFVLPPEAVDRLRAAAGRIVLESPDFQRYLKDLGDRVVKTPTPAGKLAPAP